MTDRPMTAAELADAIDPRVAIAQAPTGQVAYTVAHWSPAPRDLIAASDALRASAERERVARFRLTEIHDKAMNVVNANHARKDDHAARQHYALALHDIGEMASSALRALPVSLDLDALTERCAKALYCCEVMRATNADTLLSVASGKPISTVEPYEECADTTWRPDARAVLRELGLGREG